MPFYPERHEDDAFANFSFDVTGGSCKSAYYAVSASALDLQGTINDILGTTNTAVTGSMGLQRTLPKRHPKFPYLFASRISSLVGKGSGNAALQAPNDPSLSALNGPSISEWYEQYARYELGVEFTGPRTYAIADNSIVPVQTGASWYKPDGTQQSYSWAPEFLRYTDFDFVPQDNVIQGQQGNLSINRNGQWTLFQSPPWMWMPDWVLKITWYQVPLRFILSSQSFITAAPWRGRLNQNQLWFWPPGWLMYLGYNVKKYAPPTGFTQTIQKTPVTNPPVYTYFNYGQLADIELNFLITNRTVSSLGGAPSNGNWVAAGHNLLPDMTTGKFWYATRNDANGAQSFSNPPPWLSAPLECLFSDPDASGGPDRV